MNRLSIVDRMLVTWTLGTHPYVLGGDDCSAFVSDVMGIPRQDTETLVSNGYIRPKLTGSAEPGDFLGFCGPGSAGAAGHIAIVTDLTNDGWDVVEQRGGTIGPTLGHYSWDRIPDNWQIFETTDETPEAKRMNAWIAQDANGIAVVWIDHKSGRVVWQNVGSADAVAGWNAAGVPGPFEVPSIGALGDAATA